MSTNGFPRRRQPTARSGQATVEFALAGTLFLLLVIGSIDFGRSIFVYSQLTNGVRDSARLAKVAVSGQGSVDQNALRFRVKNGVHPITSASTPRPGLGAATVNIECDGACQSGDEITIAASVPFQAVTQELLGISPFTIRADATVTLE